MPQPLSRVHSSPSISVSAASLSNSPFCSHVSYVIASWAHIDGDLGSLLAQMLKADIETGTAMYLALTGGEARRSALLAAADAALPEWKRLLLLATLKATKPSRDQRNDFAHHAWGTAKELPGSLLLMHPRVVVERNISYRQASIENGQRIIAPKDFDADRIMVYRKKDFENAREKASRSQLLFNLLYMVIQSLTIEQARRQLLNEPEIQPALQPLIRESDPLTQEILRPPIDGEPPPRGLYPNWDENYYARLDRGEIEPLNK